MLRRKTSAKRSAATSGTDSLADFIEGHRVSIVAEWEAFARTLLPAAAGLTALVLRDHADDILAAIVRDMKSPQTSAEQTRKGRGHGKTATGKLGGETHAALRMEYGFKLVQIVAEFRALRASILRLWEARGHDTDLSGVTRFNEAIDQALAETVAHFAEKTERYQDQSLGILGHDLRNPLSGIMTGLAILTGSEPLSERGQKTAARMLRSADRMNRMIGDLLDLTRTRFGDSIPISPKRIDLGPLCGEVVAELEGRCEEAVRFTRKGDLRGTWDADRIAQMLSNLVRNAIDHGCTSGPVEVVAEDKGSEIVLRVHNRGPRIQRSAMTTIFEPMVRGPDRSQDSGLGLGLYIAAQVVLAHGGTIDVSSGDEEGTTFIVRLPRERASTKNGESPPVRVSREGRSGRRRADQSS